MMLRRVLVAPLLIPPLLLIAIAWGFAQVGYFALRLLGEASDGR